MDCITVEVLRKPNEPWGIQLSGEAPCKIDDVKINSPAEEAGIQKGDCIFSVNGVNAYDAPHDSVVQLIAESGRVIRFKMLPALSDDVTKPVHVLEEGTFWTNEDPQVLKQQKSPAKYKDEETFDHTDYARFCEILGQDSNPFEVGKFESQTSPKKSEKTKKSKHSKKKKKPGKSEVVEQSMFVITREDQKDFDENYSLNSTFKGDKASVAGAFTGDHNVILDQKADIRGVRARVEAGIQHFSFADEQDKINPEDRGKIIVYTTSLGVHRAIAQNCEQVRKLLKAYRVKFEDRDVFESAEHKEDLYKRLELAEGAPFPDMPRVYIDGVYVGGGDDLQAMSDCGDLRIRLKEFPKYNLRSKCPTCATTGLIVCHSCKGKAYKKKNRFASLKCGTCRQKGSLNCPDCLQ
ncbi:unnamed protein product [Clavelina lepadiformis]|uniref:PDZ domain-containing protein n=1 Tax=Clavelina lepadiformis TaxID=159417 RepID=A0ABP0G8A6_CLALP